MNHHQQAHQGQDQHGGVGGGHHHHQQHHGQNQTGSHPQAHPQSIQRGPVIRPSPIPANAPTEHDILAEMQTPMTRPQHPEAVAAGGFPPRMQHPGPGIQPSRDDVLMMAARRHLIPELLKTSEAVSLQTAVQNQGMNMLNTILFQFVYGQMEPQRREILLQVSFLVFLIIEYDDKHTCLRPNYKGGGCKVLKLLRTPILGVEMC